MPVYCGRTRGPDAGGVPGRQRAGQPAARRARTPARVRGGDLPRGEPDPFAADLSGIVAELGIPPGEEIKWNPPRGSFLKAAGGHLVKTLRRRMLEAAVGCQVRTVTVIIDHNAAYTRLSQAEVGKIILKWPYERVSMHLGDHDDVGIMIADKPGGGAKEEKRWLADTLELTSDGTEYVQPGRVVLPVVTADSRHVPHLQLADLIAAATTGAIAGIPRPLSSVRCWPS